MSAPAKFLFDTDFASGAGARTTITLADLEARRAEAEAIGHRKGFAAAEAQANAHAQSRIAASLALIADGMDKLHRKLEDIEARLESEAVEVAVAVAAKLAPELIAREPFAEIAALATECFRHLTAAPHVVIRLNDDIYAAAKEKLDEIAQARGYQGRLVVLAEPDIGPGDCRIEWADGGVNRDRAATQTAIDELVGRYVAARAALPAH